MSPPAPAGEGVPVDGGDEGLREVAAGDPGEAAVHARDVAATAGEGLQVHAGTERRVDGARENDRPDLGIVLHPVERIGEAFDVSWSIACGAPAHNATEISALVDAKTTTPTLTWPPS